MFFSKSFDLCAKIRPVDHSYFHRHSQGLYHKNFYRIYAVISGRMEIAMTQSGSQQGSGWVANFFSPPNKRTVFSVTYFLVWAGLAASAIDFIFYSQQIGFTNTEIGMLNASMALVGIAIQPVVGLLCDYMGGTRKMLLVLLTCGMSLSAVLPLAGTKPAVVAIVACYTLFMCSFMPLFDNWVARECIGQEGFHYGSIRWWGSLGFAIVAFTYGRLSMLGDVSFAYWGRSILLGLTLLMVLLYKHENSAKKQDTSTKTGKKADKPQVKELFSSKEYWLLILFMFLVTLPMSGANSFFPALILENGGSNSHIGLANALNAIIEIPFFLFSRRLTQKVGARGLMLVGTSFLFLRMCGFAFMGNVPGLLVSHFLIAPYVSFFNIGFIYYVYSIAPPKTETFAQTAIQAFSVGFAGVMGNFLGGIVIDHLGIHTLYYITMCLVGCALVLFLSTSYWLKHRV